MIPTPTLTAIETILCVLAVVVLLVAILLVAILATYGYARLDRRIGDVQASVDVTANDLGARIRNSNRYSDDAHDTLMARVIELESQERARRGRALSPPVKLVKKDPGDGGGAA